MSADGTTVLGWMLRQRRGIVNMRSTAAEVGLSESTLSRIERGETPSTDAISSRCATGLASTWAGRFGSCCPRCPTRAGRIQRHDRDPLRRLQRHPAPHAR